MITIKEYSIKTGIPTNELIGRSRIQKIALARQSYWYYLKTQRYKLQRIAKLFDRKSHVTIVSGIKTIENLIDTKNSCISEYMQALGIFSHQDP